MTKQDILDYFSLIDFAYNESGRLESLSSMLDELLKEQEAVEPNSEHHMFVCPVCRSGLSRYQKFCHECGKRIEWKGR